MARSDVNRAFPDDDDHWIERGLDNNIKAQLRKIKNNFESIFSWNIHQLSGFNQSLDFNIINKVQEKQEMIRDMDGTCTDNEFIFYRFFLQLITVHEDYMSKRYKDSYLEIENIVKFMKTCKFDESDKPYLNAYHHIAQSTYVYIALTLEMDSEKLLNDVKPIENFNQAEEAAICAIKARIFMEYPPKGNDVALELAHRARTLSTEPEWLLIWLKAKKRVRHRKEPYKIPGNDEINDAQLLLHTTSPKFFIHAYQLYKEAGFIHEMHNNLKLSKMFYNRSFDVAKKSIELAGNDTKLMNSILLHYLHFPKNLLSKDFIDKIIEKLTNVKNSIVHLTIGRYYLNREKNYDKAKIHFTLGKEYGNFNSSMQLLKVECLLQPINKFPYVQTLNKMYNDFQNPKRKLTILIHILMYYNYYDYNPKKIMIYLKLYVDQDIEDSIKKRQLMFVRPLFNKDKDLLFIKANEFLNVLSMNIKELMKNKDWGEEENNTFDRFNKILKLNIDDNNTNVNEKKETWRKQVDLSENNSYNSHQENKESWRKQLDSRPVSGSHLFKNSHKKK